MTLAKDRRGGYTYGDYLTWPEEERWELIDGVAYDMAPAPSRNHQEILLELSRQVANFFLDRPCRVYVAPFDVRLPKGDEADEQTETVVQPDLAVICDSSKLDEQGCRGAPDWIIEVLSPATAAKDQIQKRVLYERVGVKEYWTVHPTDKLVTVWLKSGKGTYGKPNIVEGKGTLTVATFPELEINLDQMFAHR